MPGWGRENRGGEVAGGGGRGRFFLLLSLPNSRAEFANSQSPSHQAEPGVSVTKMSGCPFPGAACPRSMQGTQAAIRGCPALSGGCTSPCEASPWKVCCPEKKEPAPPRRSPGAASAAPRVSRVLWEGAAQPPAAPGGSRPWRSQASGSLKPLPAWPRWICLSVLQLLSVSVSLSVFLFLGC